MHQRMRDYCIAMIASSGNDLAPTDHEISELAHDVAQRLEQKLHGVLPWDAQQESVMHGWWIACANYNPSRKVVSEIG
jgi:hypothetical protein